MSPRRDAATMPPAQAAELGKTIRDLREKAGFLGIAAAARRCVINDAYWSQLENGGILDRETGERRPIHPTAGTLVLIVWQLPVTDPKDQARLFEIGGYPELKPRPVGLPRVEDLGDWRDYSIPDLRAIEDEAGRERYRREAQRSRRDRRDASG